VKHLRPAIAQIYLAALFDAYLKGTAVPGNNSSRRVLGFVLSPFQVPASSASPLLFLCDDRFLFPSLVFRSSQVQTFAVGLPVRST